jgi:hypothetical protein
MIAADKQEYVRAERQYNDLKKRYDSWRQWKENRNPARYLLEKDYGYDSKHAMHLVRLMLMAKEIMTLGEVIVTRPDAKFLLSIRDGAWAYNKLISWAEEIELELTELYKTCTLQHGPKMNEINDLCVELIKEAEKDNFPFGSK